MSSPVQNINNIAPLDEENIKKSPSDPVQADYEEGKKFLENGNATQAAVALHNALVGYKERDDKNGIANASNQIGKVCLHREEFEKAKQHFDCAWEICDDLGDPASLLALLRQYTQVYIGMAQYDKAIEACIDLLGRYQDNNDPRGSVETLEKIAEIYLKAQETKKAADTYRTIASIHANFKHDTIAEGFMKMAQQLEEEV